MKAIAAVASLMVFLPSICHAAGLPDGAKPVSAADLKKTFADKSYKNSGPGIGNIFLSKDGKVRGVGIGTTFAVATDGTWTANDSGRLCYEANFASLADLALKTPGDKVVQCFDFQQAGGSIFQRYAGNGSMAVDLKAMDWVAFKSAKPDPKDLTNNLAGGDTTGGRMKEITALVAKPAAAVPQYGQKLTSDAIKAVIWGHTEQHAKNPTFSLKVDADGKTQIIDTSPNGRNDSGVSRVVNDMYCVHAPLDRPERCFLIYKDATQYYYLFPDGKLNFPFTTS